MFDEKLFENQWSNEGVLMEEKIYSPKFLFALLKFSDTRRAILLFSNVLGLSKLEEAEENITLLKEGLMKTEKEDEYPPDYKGDRTFAKDIDDIVEYLRIAIRDVLKQKGVTPKPV